MKLQYIEEELNRALTDLTRAQSAQAPMGDVLPGAQALDDGVARLCDLSRDLERARLLGSGA